MIGPMDCAGDQLQEPSSAPAPIQKPSKPTAAPAVSISAQTYARLLSLADQAPLDCLDLSPRTLASAKTMGYNQIGQIRSAPMHRLLDDLGEDRADELRRALHDFGMRPRGGDDL